MDLVSNGRSILADLESLENFSEVSTSWAETIMEILKEQFASRDVLFDFKNNDGRAFELKSCSSDEAKIITGKDKIYYLTLDLANDESDLAFMSEKNSPGKPLGFYLINYYEKNHPFLGFEEENVEGLIGEVALVHVCPEFRNKNYGSLLLGLSAAEIISNESCDYLRFRAFVNKVDQSLEKLGYQVRTNNNCRDYLIDLDDREKVWENFKGYLRRHIL
ncbi:hypothetical protein HN681_01360 [archaeon]|jgi:hypothetical protein|nr:hypothetical protein [archaeon]MBT3730577.1 hypothetical protein [archaeon]MBT4669479.1 hypothetical protein [archaeon]MBT5030236.1 hypothetical protein [archaeon]MBT5287665.1 hypothetical protein [archaeon]